MGWHKTVWLMVVSLLAGGMSHGQAPKYYEFHPQSIMALGRGFTVADLTQAKQECITFDQDLLDGNSSLSTEAYIQLASNFQTLRQALAMDASIDISYLIFTGNAHFSISQENLMRSDDVSLVMTFKSEYGRVGMKNVKIEDFAQRMLDQHLLKQFEAVCGSQMALIKRRGASVSAIITLHSVDTTARSKMSGSLGAKVDLGIISGDLKSTITGEIDRAAGEGRLSIQIVSTGGEGFADLSSSVSKIGASKEKIFDQLQQGMADYLKNFNAANAAPLGYHVGPMPGYAEAQDDLWGVEKENRLSRLVDKYRQLHSARADVTEILAKRDPRADILSDSEKNQLAQLEAPLDSYLSRLSTIHARCKAATNDHLDVCVLPKNIPTIPTFLEPIRNVWVESLLVVDGRVWNATRSRAIFDDPGKGDYLTRVTRRDPDAKEVAEVLRIHGRVLDAALIASDEDDTHHQQLKVFYPKHTKGDSVHIPGNGLTLGVSSFYSNQPNMTDIDPTRVAHYVADELECPIQNRTENWPRNELNLRKQLFLSVRDAFGQTSQFKIADFQTGRAFPGFFDWTLFVQQKYKTDNVASTLGRFCRKDEIAHEEKIWNNEDK
jgi:hypothetical protein